MSKITQRVLYLLYFPLGSATLYFQKIFIILPFMSLLQIATVSKRFLEL